MLDFNNFVMEIHFESFKIILLLIFKHFHFVLLMATLPNFYQIRTTQNICPVSFYLQINEIQIIQCLLKQIHITCMHWSGKY